MKDFLIKHPKTRVFLGIAILAIFGIITLLFFNLQKTHAYTGGVVFSRWVGNQFEGSFYFKENGQKVNILTRTGCISQINGTGMDLIYMAGSPPFFENSKKYYFFGNTSTGTVFRTCDLNSNTIAESYAPVNFGSLNSTTGTNINVSSNFSTGRFPFISFVQSGPAYFVNSSTGQLFTGYGTSFSIYLQTRKIAYTNPFLYYQKFIGGTSFNLYKVNLSQSSASIDLGIPLLAGNFSNAGLSLSGSNLFGITSTGAIFRLSTTTDTLQELRALPNGSAGFLAGSYPDTQAYGGRIYINYSGGLASISETGPLDFKFHGTSVGNTDRLSLSLLEESGGNSYSPNYTANVSGLRCSSENLPDPANVTNWRNDFLSGGLIFSSGNNYGSGTTRSYIVGFSGGVYEGVIWPNTTENLGPSGSVVHTGSFDWPGDSVKSYLRGDSTKILISFQSARGGQPNIVQIGGVTDYPLIGAFQAQMLLQNGIQANYTATASGSNVATFGLGDGLKIASVGLAYINSWDSMRYAYSEPIKKVSCDWNEGDNLCQWNFVGPNLVCEAEMLPGGLRAGACGIAGSGSVYGSGSCVPLTNASGALIPVNVLGYTLFDENGNPIGKIEQNNNRISIDFSCGFLEEDSWYETISKTVLCPFKIAKDAYLKISEDSYKITDIGTSVGNIGGSVLSGSVTHQEQAYTGTNAFVLNMLSAQEKAGENRFVKLSFALLIFFIIATFLMIFAGIIKSKKDEFNN